MAEDRLSVVCGHKDDCYLPYVKQVDGNDITDVNEMSPTASVH